MAKYRLRCRKVKRKLDEYLVLRKTDEFASYRLIFSIRGRWCPLRTCWGRPKFVQHWSYINDFYGIRRSQGEKGMAWGTKWGMARRGGQRRYSGMTLAELQLK